MSPFWGGVLAGCLFILGCSLFALGLLVAADVRAERREKAETKRRHPAGREMPPAFAAWLRDEIAAEVARAEAQVLADDDAVFAVVEAWREEEL